LIQKPERNTGHIIFLQLISPPGELAGNSRKWGDTPTDVKEAVVNMIINEGREAGLSDRDIAILLAIAYVESGFNPDAAALTSTAAGIGQFIKDTWSEYGEGDPFDTQANIRALIKEYIDIKNKVTKFGLSEDYIYINSIMMDWVAMNITKILEV
jgi:putative chitinase